MAVLPDRVLLEILKNRFQSVANEMAYNVLRTGHTVFIKETADFGLGLATPAGELFAAPINLGVSVMIGMFCGHAFAAIPEYDEGDICVSNDPYLTAGLSTHLCDIFMWKPIFSEGQLVCFAMGFIHSSDVGGKVPGSISPTSTDIWQEGIRVPPIKLCRRGELNQDLLRVFLLNSRIPEQNWGDLKALIGAMNTAERRMRALVDRYGFETITRAGDGLLAYAEKQARTMIERLPDGETSFTDFMEGDVIGGPPVRLHCTLRVRGSELTLDFAGTDPQVPASLNLPTFSQTGHYMIVPGIVNYLRTKDPSIPYNSGLVRPLRIVAPEGSLVNPRLNTACGNRAATMRRCWEISMGALSRLDPAYIPSAGGGIFSTILLACPDPETGEARVSVAQCLAGGSGARPAKDGIEGAEFSSFVRNLPNEVLETEMPVEVIRYGLREDSAGAGRHRGGSGLEFTFRCLVPHMILTARGLERFYFRPWGLGGGRASCQTRVILNLGTPGERELGKIDVLELELGDVIQFLTPGGAGYGSPLERDPAVVVEDVRSGLVSIESAGALYGVVLTADGKPDLQATASSRRKLREETRERDVDYGPEREAHDAVWTSPVRERLAALLDDIPTAYRGLVRRKALGAITELARVNGDVTLEDIETLVCQLKTRWVPQRSAV